MLHRANLSPFKAICFSKFILTHFYNFFISFISKTSYLSFSSHMYKSNKICCQLDDPVILYCTFVSSSLLALSLFLSAGISASRTACFWYVVTGSTTLPSVHCLLFLKFSSFLTLRLSHPNRWRQMVTLPVAGSAGDCFLFPPHCFQVHAQRGIIIFLL